MLFCLCSFVLMLFCAYALLLMLCCAYAISLMLCCAYALLLMPFGAYALSDMLFLCSLLILEHPIGLRQELRHNATHDASGLGVLHTLPSTHNVSIP